MPNTQNDKLLELIDKVRESYYSLKKKNPNNKLLSYVEFGGPECNSIGILRGKELRGCFGDDDFSILEGYYLALFFEDIAEELKSGKTYKQGVTSY